VGRTQKLIIGGDETSWTVIGDDDLPVAPVEVCLST
jgi:hypothetical protein